MPEGPSRLGDVRDRVASALSIPSGLVNIESHQVGLSGWVLRCLGKADGAQFFAKVFLVDPYPVPPRFSTPWEELVGPEKPHRPVEEQIAAEWSMARKIYSLLGGRNIPAPLGCSLGDRTLVFEQVRGSRLDHYVKWTWPAGEKVGPAETAVFQAGEWLRAMHSSSPQGCETADLAEVNDTLRRLIRKRRLDSSPYAEWALKPLEFLARDLAPRTSVHMPVALNHGDFSLPNLIWDNDREELWVVDFELAARKATLHDLCTMIFELRKPLLHPLTSQRAVRIRESAFWAGYGPIAQDFFAFVNALVTARLFYQSFPRISTLAARRGWKGWLKATAYQRLFQRYATTRIWRHAGLQED